MKKLKHRFMIVCVVLTAPLKGSFYIYRNSGFHGYEKIYEKSEIWNMTASQMRAALSFAFDKAYESPSLKSVLQYMRLHNAHLKKSQQFSEMWQRAVWRYPEMDFNASFPTSHIGRVIKKKEDVKLLKKQMIENIHESCLLLFASDDESGVAMAQVCLRISQEMQWPVYVLQRDEHAKLFQKWSIQETPALFLVSQRLRVVLRIGGGVLSEEEVVYRIKESHHDLDRMCAND